MSKITQRAGRQQWSSRRFLTYRGAEDFKKRVIDSGGKVKSLRMMFGPRIRTTYHVVYSETRVGPK